MKIQRFFINQKIEDRPEISIADIAIIHQVKNVLRLREGDELIMLDGSGVEFHGVIKIISKEILVCSKIKIKSNPQVINSINLYFSMLKKDKAEWVLQKCTELGVIHFIPTISDRTEKINLKRERAELIIKEAAEQSEKVFLPTFHETVELDEALVDLKPEETFYLDIEAEKINIADLKTKRNLNIFVGPEGGWSDKDRELFAKHGIKKYSLGDFVLRAETASVAIVSALKI